MEFALTYDAIAKRIDHSLLQPTLTDDDLADGCRLAARYRVASVCIKPYAVPLAKAILEGSGVAVGTTVGFPHGGHTTFTKLTEAMNALDDGATELDMVVNIGQVLGGEWQAIADDIEPIVGIAHERGAIVKVIFENCYLDDEQKTRLCAICGDHHADYVKTSTGYGTGGSTDADLILMRKAAPKHVKLKAAGGIRDLAGAIRVAELGCDRIGASRTAEILDALKARLAGKAEPAPVSLERGGY
jgi:deoxyribose-phosphate aldolase